MKTRFAFYFTLGLFAFVIYFLVVFNLLIWLVNPDYVFNLIYIRNNEDNIWADFLIFIFCFASGGVLIGSLFMRPINSIMSIISGMAEGKHTSPKMFQFPNYLFKEVFGNLEKLSAELKRSEHEREILENAKKDWISGISHDIKTPLSYITGYSSLLMDDITIFTPEEQKSYLGEIYQKAIFIESLVEDLNFSFSLENAGKIPLKLHRCNLIPFLQDLIAEYASGEIANAYNFAFYSDFDNVFVEIDEQLIKRAIGNILQNCIEHNPPGTNIEISIGTAGDKSQICLTIADNGIGIKKESLKHLFNKYFSESNVQKQGKGIGLYITNQILEAHYVKVNVSSSKSGTCFQLIFPC